jgi:hypothetical protein
MIEEDPVKYFQAAMLFAWADDRVKLHRILLLRSDTEIREFFRFNSENVLVIFDQDEMFNQSDNAKATKLHTWLNGCEYERPTLWSTSTNDERHHEAGLYTDSRAYYLDGGYTKVSKQNYGALPPHCFSYLLHQK